jgi:hypothetical protein
MEVKTSVNTSAAITIFERQFHYSEDIIFLQLCQKQASDDRSNLHQPY